jgi:hypothetical protein
MKYISQILLCFLILGFILIAFCEGEWSPLIALALSYGCYKSVFCFGNDTTLYDPVDFIEE